MAYLHCHSCNWSQDDFWTKKYNPFTKWRDYFTWLIKPRIMEMDDWIVDDLEEYTGTKVKRFKSVKNGQIRVFSWQWLWLETVKEWKIFRKQKWWTWKSWKNASSNAVCPQCGKRKFDID